ncbi:MAG: transcriptional repressor [Candidatus Eisenbacteria bacterium]|uniref:Transcriptional repressor n=1 Tax=Eiseniibacteriota bacterium TaxID=2212470 RepID=A0A956RN20_UNCEI|nr:transcriptional repressor [Candidatus Eisenbacteria bacterium]
MSRGAQSLTATRAGGRRTRQRRAIVEVITEAQRPLTSNEVLELASQRCPGIGIATVYRALRSGVEEGWLSTVELPSQPDRFERAGKEHHHHFHCRVCGLVFELEPCELRVGGSAPAGFLVEEHEILLFGRCAACAQKRNPAKRVGSSS